jgi:UPF0755 protein
MNQYKRFKKLILAALLFIFVIILAFKISYKKAIEKPLKSSENTILIEVKQGEGFNDILNKLDNENKLSNKLMIKVNLAIDKRNIKLREGMYEIDSNSTLDNLISSLENESDDKALIKLTIPEGYSIEEIAKTIEEKEICSKEDFLQAVKNYELPKYVIDNNKKRYNLEGFLYPDTYFIKKGSDSNYIIKVMLNRFEQILDQLKNETKLDIKDVDVEKIITIASLIEKEAKVPKDRPLISSVIYNRLDKNMKLQLDAAVIYSLGYHVDVVLNKHLEINSPYNVYKYKGLPVGPIASPGTDSIKAALRPEKTDYIYYILQTDGSHYFTNNEDDFLKKKKELGY